MKATGGLIVLGTLVVIGFFFLASWLTMVLVNVVLHHYHVTPLDYGCGMALVGLSALLLGGGRVKNGKD